MTTISMGISIRLGASGEHVSAGPCFTPKSTGLNYLLSVGHGFQEPGNEHTVQGYVEDSWQVIGRRVVWGTNEEADFALVKLDSSVSVASDGKERMHLVFEENPQIGEEVRGLVIRAQSGRKQLRGQLKKKGDLDGWVPGSPVHEDQLTVTVQSDTSKVIGGDSGMGVWQGQKLVGVEWAISVDGGQQDYYATPITNYFRNVVTRLNEYYEKFKDSANPPQRFYLVKEALTAMDENDLLFDLIEN